jgi:hypothetical protein
MKTKNILYTNYRRKASKETHITEEKDVSFKTKFEEESGQPITNTQRKKKKKNFFVGTVNIVLVVFFFFP